MDIKLSKNSEGVYLLELAGKLDLFNSDRFKNYVMKIIKSGIDCLIISLKNVSIINSAGIGALINVFSTLKKLNFTLIMLVPEGPVLNALEVSRLRSYFAIVHTLKDALNIVSPSASRAGRGAVAGKA